MLTFQLISGIGTKIEKMFVIENQVNQKTLKGIWWVTIVNSIIYAA